jgi:hypothetical protein
MSEEDEVTQAIRRLDSGDRHDVEFEFAKTVRTLVVNHRIPIDHAYVALIFAVARGHNFEIRTGNRWFDAEFRQGLEYYAAVSNRFEGMPARAALLGEYHILSLVPAVRDDLIACDSAIEAILPLNALIEGADSGNLASQNALIIAETSPMTAQNIREFINEEIIEKSWYKARRSSSADS